MWIPTSFFACLRPGLRDERSDENACLYGKIDEVTFGQQSGPPASPRQVQQLLALLKDAGHTDFRDARGPMGFTQRQAGGKFTRDEAAAFIDQLQDKETDAGADAFQLPSCPHSNS